MAAPIREDNPAAGHREGSGTSAGTAACRLDFITAIPQDVRRGSGCFVGIQTLAKGLAALQCNVNMVIPKLHLPVFSLERVLFNESLRFHTFTPGAITVGFDADAYTVAGRKGHPHVASIKGVMADVLPYERGAAKASMAFQARLERRHARRADLVVTPSRYCAEQLEELYGVRNAVVIPELIDLAQWDDLLRNVPPSAPTGRFVVLCVCRFYPRKRVDLLLRAAAILQPRMPELEVRIVGGGMEAAPLRRLCQELRLEKTVEWVGDATLRRLAEEYQRSDMFCFPSVQEGFGIVLLEAMAAGKAIVATRSAAIPEVAPHAWLVEPNSAEALAAGIEGLYTDSELRARMGTLGRRFVERFEMMRVSQVFLDTVSKLL